MRTNPATGLPEDTEAQETAGGAVRQQEVAADVAPPVAFPPPTPDIASTYDPIPEIPSNEVRVTGANGQPLDASLAPPLPEPQLPDLAPPELPPVQLTEPALGAAPPIPAPGEVPGLAAPLSGITQPELPGRVGEVPGPDAGSDQLVPATNPADLTAQRIEERRKQGEENVKEAKIREDVAKKTADIDAKYVDDRARTIKETEDNYAKGRDRINQKFEAYKAMGEKDVWGDNATVSKVLAGIFALVAGRPAAAFIIGAVNGLEEKKKLEMSIQEKDIKQSGEALEADRVAGREKVRDWDLQKAAGLGSIASRGKAELAARGVPAQERDTNKDLLAIQAAANEAKRKADIEFHKETERKAKDELDRMKAEAQIKKDNAIADELGKRTHKPYGAGGGTAAGGGGIGSKAEQLAKAIREGEDDGQGGRRELTQDEKIHAANGLGIPLEGKAGHVTLKTVNSGIAFDANNARKGAGADGAGDTKAIDASFKPFRVEAIGTPRSPGPVVELGKIEEMRKTMADAAASGDSDKIKTAMVKAKEQAGTLMSGGKMTLGQIKIMHELESTVDHMVSTYGKWSGNPTEGAGAVKRLSQLIESAGDESANRVKSIRERSMEQHLAPNIGVANTPEKKRAFEAANAGVFSGAEWKGQRLFEEGQASANRASGASGASATPPKVNPTPPKTNPTPSPLSLKEKTEATLWARTHRDDPRSKPILDALGE